MSTIKHHHQSAMFYRGNCLGSLASYWLRPAKQTKPASGCGQSSLMRKLASFLRVHFGRGENLFVALISAPFGVRSLSFYSRKDATYCVVCSVQTNRKPPLRTIRAVIYWFVCLFVVVVVVVVVVWKESSLSNLKSLRQSKSCCSERSFCSGGLTLF